MAIKLTFTDDSTGVVHTDSYHKILYVTNDQYIKEAIISIAIYKDEAAKDDLKAPFARYQYVCQSTDYTTYLSSSALDAINKNVFSQAYAFLKTQEPGEPGYGGCKYDYKNDGVDV